MANELTWNINNSTSAPGQGFKPAMSAPLDSRFIVNKYEDLFTNPQSTFSGTGTGENAFTFIYPGMQVYVLETKSTYMFVGDYEYLDSAKTKPNGVPTSIVIEKNWVKVTDSEGSKAIDDKIDNLKDYVVDLSKEYVISLVNDSSENLFKLYNSTENLKQIFNDVRKTTHSHDNNYELGCDISNIMMQFGENQPMDTDMHNFAGTAFSHFYPNTGFIRIDPNRDGASMWLQLEYLIDGVVGVTSITATNTSELKKYAQSKIVIKIFNDGTYELTVGPSPLEEKINTTKDNLSQEITSSIETLEEDLEQKIFVNSSDIDLLKKNLEDSVNELNSKFAWQKGSGQDSAQLPENNASGAFSVAAGVMNRTYGSGSQAFGQNNTTIGEISSTFGFNNTTYNCGEFSVGFNSQSYTYNFPETDQINPFFDGSKDKTVFNIGNGFDSSSISPIDDDDLDSSDVFIGTIRHNALDVRQSGDIFISDTSADGKYYEKPMINLQEKLKEIDEKLADDSVGSNTYYTKNEIDDKFIFLSADLNQQIYSKNPFITIGEEFISINNTLKVNSDFDNVTWNNYTNNGTIYIILDLHTGKEECIGLNYWIANYSGKPTEMLWRYNGEDTWRVVKTNNVSLEDGKFPADTVYRIDFSGITSDILKCNRSSDTFVYGDEDLEENSDTTKIDYIWEGTDYGGETLIHFDKEKFKEYIKNLNIFSSGGSDCNCGEKIEELDTKVNDLNDKVDDLADKIDNNPSNPGTEQSISFPDGIAIAQNSDIRLECDANGVISDDTWRKFSDNIQKAIDDNGLGQKFAKYNPICLGGTIVSLSKNAEAGPNYTTSHIKMQGITVLNGINSGTNVIFTHPVVFELMIATDGFYIATTGRIIQDLTKEKETNLPTINFRSYNGASNIIDFNEISDLSINQNMFAVNKNGDGILQYTLLSEYQKGETNGIAPLVDGKIPEQYLPTSSSDSIYEIVDKLPEVGEPNKIYLVHVSQLVMSGEADATDITKAVTAKNQYDEYIWVVDKSNSFWEKLDGIKVESKETKYEADWNANEGELGFIKNRPCYYDESTVMSTGNSLTTQVSDGVYKTTVILSTSGVKNVDLSDEFILQYGMLGTRVKLHAYELNNYFVFTDSTEDLPDDNRIFSNPPSYLPEGCNFLFFCHKSTSSPITTSAYSRTNAYSLPKIIQIKQKVLDNHCLQYASETSDGIITKSYKNNLDKLINDVNSYESRGDRALALGVSGASKEVTEWPCTMRSSVGTVNTYELSISSYNWDNGITKYVYLTNVQGLPAYAEATVKIYSADETAVYINKSISKYTIGNMYKFTITKLAKGFFVSVDEFIKQ